MTDYVLMPEEATPEMEQAAEKYWNDRKFKALSDDPRTWKGLYAAMRAAAPVVQGEPVGYIRKSALELMKRDELGVRANIIKEPRYQDCIAIYTAPQPAEQPTISAYACTVPDDCETLHWRGQILSMNELVSVAQPAVDEKRLLSYAEDLIRRLREWKTSAHRKQGGEV